MHDGEELTADDVKRSVERALHPTTPNPNASYFDGIVGYAAYRRRGPPSTSTGSWSTGATSSRSTSREPDATFLSVLGDARRCGPSADARGRSLRRHVAAVRRGTLQAAAGRMAARHEPSPRAARCDTSAPGLPYLDAVEWTFNMPQLTQRFRFEAGELDFLREISQADQARFAADPRWRPFGSTDADTTLYGESMNTTHAALRQRRGAARGRRRDRSRALPAPQARVRHAPRSAHPSAAFPATSAVAASAPALRLRRRARAHAKGRLPVRPGDRPRAAGPSSIDYLVYDQSLLDRTRRSSCSRSWRRSACASSSGS